MAQRYIPEISDGDKRVLLIDGKPVPHCLARIPKPGESRGNLAAGGAGVAQPLTARDREIAETLGPVLWRRGLLLVGLDVIGDWLTEVNVTSPTCFREIPDRPASTWPGCSSTRSRRPRGRPGGTARPPRRLSSAATKAARRGKVLPWCPAALVVHGLGKPASARSVKLRHTVLQH